MTELISESLKGIPADADLAKRTLAKSILNQNPAFETVAFVLPNGDMYFTEPYTKQQSLTRLNWEHRDWYKGTVTTMQPYISEVYNATATRTYAVSVNIPVFSDSGEFMGLWRSVVDLDELYNSIDFLDSEYLVIFDHKGTELPISLGIFEEEKPRNIMELQSTRLTLEGNSGIITEVSDNQEYVIAYTPITIPSQQWGAILIEPVGVVYSEINSIKSVLYTLLIIISISIVSSGLFYYKNIKSKILLQHRLEDELKLKSEKLFKAERMSAIGHLASRIAHDIRNPLSVIKTNANIIDLKLKNVKEINLEKNLETINRSIFRISHQIDDVLDFIRSKPLFLGEYSVEKIINSSLEELVIPPEIKIRKNISDFNLLCDSTQLQSVFSNLILNAVQSLGDSGEITISCSQTKDDSKITISDSGSGVLEENISKIFEPLFTTKQTGTGLGLSSCKTIITSHGGDITYSNNPSTFSIILPHLEKQNDKKFSDNN